MFALYFIVAVIVTLTVLIYCSLVIFTYIRALDFNIELTGLSAFILPIMMFNIHLKLYNDLRLTDKKKANTSMKFLLLNYPVALTIILTMIVNKIVEKLTTEEVSYKKVSHPNRNVINQNSLRKSFSTLLQTGFYNQAFMKMNA